MTYLAWAYGIIWSLLFVYFVSLGFKLMRLEREIGALKEELERR